MYDFIIAADVMRDFNALGKCSCGEDYLKDEGCAVACSDGELVEDNTMTEPTYCLGCYDEATHDTTGRGDANEPTCGKCCDQCGETGCDSSKYIDPRDDTSDHEYQAYKDRD